MKLRLHPPFYETAYICTCQKNRFTEAGGHDVVHVKATEIREGVLKSPQVFYFLTPIDHRKFNSRRKLLSPFFFKSSSPLVIDPLIDSYRNRPLRDHLAVVLVQYWTPRVKKRLSLFGIYVQVLTCSYISTDLDHHVLYGWHYHFHDWVGHTEFESYVNSSSTIVFSKWLVPSLMGIRGISYHPIFAVQYRDMVGYRRKHDRPQKVIPKWALVFDLFTYRLYFMFIINGHICFVCHFHYCLLFPFGSVYCSFSAFSSFAIIHITHLCFNLFYFIESLVFISYISLSYFSFISTPTYQRWGYAGRMLTLTHILGAPYLWRHLISYKIRHEIGFQGGSMVFGGDGTLIPYPTPRWGPQ